MKTALMKVPFLDLRVPQEERKALLQAIDTVFQHGRLILGPEVTELENTLAKYCHKKFAVGMNSGTDSLFLALKALNIGPGDEVITTSLSWIATTNAIAMTGATVVFADIQEDLNIDPASVEKLITPKTKAIMPVHYTGRVCNMQAFKSLVDKYSIRLVEDAAQSFGALYKGNPAGSFGSISCFSMNPMKIFAACGEAGMVMTDDEAVYQFLISLRYNGTVNKEKCIATSLNCRLDTIQAAILLERLKSVDSIISRRRGIADFYNQQLSSYVQVPVEQPFERNVYYTYMIRTQRRDELKKFLEEKGIETKIQHPFLMCQQPIYQKYLHKPVPKAEKIVQEILCLPMHEKMTQQEQEYVVEWIERFFHG
ncbi:MAG TPA: DegT/DnrJ/EryC1/StrS family aminotransferase [Chlamydiales bacterium]|nr:DegT/DnrJ/EryC1/StrS family aminotransferase [Chlamydiales bacterium]